MSRPVTRSMTRITSNKTNRSDPAGIASEESTQIFPFLLLPGEIRNAIYWKLLAPKDPHGLINAIPLFGAQPALSRVNKQIRAESLSIYCAENELRMEIQGRSGRIGGPMRNVRELVVYIIFDDFRTWKASFDISGGRYKRLGGWRLGEDETNWSDLLGIVTLLNNRVNAVPMSYRMQLETQQHLDRIMWLLGLRFSPNLFTDVTLSRG
ncbi:hypothetical protein LA080_009288 [Diaporthe eres]|nr:hypothetical protein LA080_009288 [Diaporthe eres]